MILAFLLQHMQRCSHILTAVLFSSFYPATILLKIDSIRAHESHYRWDENLPCSLRTQVTFREPEYREVEHPVCARTAGASADVSKSTTKFRLIKTQRELIRAVTRKSGRLMNSLHRLATPGVIPVRRSRGPSRSCVAVSFAARVSDQRTGSHTLLRVCLGAGS